MFNTSQNPLGIWSWHCHHDVWTYPSYLLYYSKPYIYFYYYHPPFLCIMEASSLLRRKCACGRTMSSTEEILVWDHGGRWSVLGGRGGLGYVALVDVTYMSSKVGAFLWPFGCVAWVPYSSLVPSWGQCRASGICSEVLDGNSFVKEAIYNSSSHFWTMLYTFGWYNIIW